MPPDSAAAGWTLDPQLAADTRALGELPLCRVLLANDANYPWLILVPRRRGITEIADLNDVDQAELIGEVAQVSRALKAIAHCDKINVAALGNVVAQLHVHVIARSRADAAWPKPVWGAVEAKIYEAAELEKLVTPLRQRLALAPL